MSLLRATPRPGPDRALAASIVVAFLASLAAALVAAALAPAADDRTPPLVGHPAPDFRLPRLDDPACSIGPAEFRGQVWMLNVWASWCAPCRQEHPLLVALAREQGLSLVGLNHRDDPRAADEWLRRLGDPYRVTAVDRDGRVGADYGVLGVPETLVIDRAGIVRLRHVGPVTAEAWARQLQPLLVALQR